MRREFRESVATTAQRHDNLRANLFTQLVDQRVNRTVTWLVGSAEDSLRQLSAGHMRMMGHVKHRQRFIFGCRQIAKPSVGPAHIAAIGQKAPAWRSGQRCIKSRCNRAANATADIRGGSESSAAEQ